MFNVYQLLFNVLPITKALDSWLQSALYIDILLWDGNDSPKTVFLKFESILDSPEGFA